jgi:outer membrane protein TolC
MANAQFGRPPAETVEYAAPSSETMNDVPNAPSAPRSAQQQSPFFGSVVTQKATAEPLQLTIAEAIDLGLRNNLGLILSAQGGQAARAARLRSLSNLLPNLNLHVTESAQQINLAAYGFPVPAGQPAVIGPFGVFDARGAVTWRVLDFKATNDLNTSTENVRAAQLSYQDARELVTLVVASQYLLALADQARVDAAQAQLDTAQALYNQSVDLKKHGVIPGIDLLRSQVELQSRQQRLIALKNEAEKQKLQLGRAIGLPNAQQIVLTDRMPEAPEPPLTMEVAIQRALQQRRDLGRARSLVRAAESNKRAQESQYLPSLRADSDYGTLGQTLGNSHGTFTAAATLNIPIFQGGRYRADVQQAEVQIQQRKAELSDAEAKIENEVRQAFMDVQSATAQVSVAKSAVDLANQQLTQARDRFAAGVSGSLEVVQSEQAVADANDNLISALYANNVAKATLARAVGSAERSVKEFLGAK